MKRIYITAVPLPSNFLLNPQPVQCVNIQLCDDASLTFPISRLIEATMEPGDEALVITVRQANDSGDENLNRLRADLEQLRIPYRLADITTPESQVKDSLLDLFRDLAKAIEPQCCIHADTTFGTKTFPILLFSALNYAEKVKNCEIINLIYQEQRRDAVTHKPTTTSIYDITSLFYLNGVVNMLGRSDSSVKDKDELLDSLLNL